MPKLPQTTVAFPVREGALKSTANQRIDYGVYERVPETLRPGSDEHVRYSGNLLKQRDQNYRAALSTGATDFEEAIAYELQEKRLFLDALNHILKEEHGITADVKEQFANMARASVESDVNLYCSQPMLVMRDYSLAQAENLARCGVSETTTHYGSSFRFLLKKIGKSEAMVAVSMFEMDVRPWELLKKYGVTDAMQKNYCESFLRMAGMAEHDYLHSMIDLAMPYAPYHFPSQDYNFSEVEPPSLLHHEDFMLALQAKICDRLFKEHPMRKTRVLQWAAGEANLIATMQRTAISTAMAQGAPESEITAIKEATTYLTEIYAHRLFRVISPEDPDLRTTFDWKWKPEKMVDAHGETKITKPAMRVETSVADVFNKIELTTPERLLHAWRGPPLTDSFSQVVRHCEEYLHDTYARIHTMDKMKIYLLDKPAHQMLDPDERAQAVSEEMPLPEILARFGEAIPYLQKNHAAEISQRESTGWQRH